MHNHSETQSQGKQPYRTPYVEEIGAVGDVTASGGSPLSDVMPFVDGTAFPPPS